MSDLTPASPVLGWQGPIAVLDLWCGELDRRMFHEIEWPDLPRSMGSSHYSDVSVGTVDEIQILTADDGTRYVWGRGRFSSTPEGVSAATQVAEGTLRTVSVEIRDGAYTEWPILDDDGEVLGWAMEWERAVIGAFALERNPAFAGAVIVPDADAASYVYVPPETPNPSDGTAPDDGERPEADPVEVDGEMSGAALSAAVGVLRSEVDTFRQAGAGPHQFPAAHFTKLKMDGPSRWHVSASGEVTGTPIIFGKTHRANSRWTAAYNPRDDLSEWLVGATSLDNGSTIRTGVIVSDGLHAPAHQAGTSADNVRQLIESTATQLAVVNAWQDQHGIHVHGHTLPGVTPEQVTRAMAGCLSVDQRDLGDGRGFLTMGVLAVNTCGFSPDAHVVTVEDGEPVRRLVASAAPDGCDCGGTCGGCGVVTNASAITWTPKQIEDYQAAYVGGSSGSFVVDLTTGQASVTTPDPEPAPVVVDLGKLAAEDEKMRQARLKAAVAAKPKG